MLPDALLLGGAKAPGGPRNLTAKALTEQPAAAHVSELLAVVTRSKHDVMYLEALVSGSNGRLVVTNRETPGLSRTDLGGPKKAGSIQSLSGSGPF